MNQFIVLFTVCIFFSNFANAQLSSSNYSTLSDRYVGGETINEDNKKNLVGRWEIEKIGVVGFDARDSSKYDDNFIEFMKIKRNLKKIKFFSDNSWISFKSYKFEIKKNSNNSFYFVVGKKQKILIDECRFISDSYLICILNTDGIIGDGSSSLYVGYSKHK